MNRVTIERKIINNNDTTHGSQNFCSKGLLQGIEILENENYINILIDEYFDVFNGITQ
jgi:hypothetical protein